MVSELLEAGHSYDAVYGEYCIDELILHYESMLRTRAKKTQREAAAIRAATHAAKKGWREFNRHLDQTWRNIELAAGRSIHRQGDFFAGLSRVRAGKTAKAPRRKRDADS